MDPEEIRLALEELEKLRKVTYRGPHPQKHLFKYFDWMRQKIASDAAADIKATEMIKEMAATTQSTLSDVLRASLNMAHAVTVLTARIEAIEAKVK